MPKLPIARDHASDAWGSFLSQSSYARLMLLNSIDYRLKAQQNRLETVSPEDLRVTQALVTELKQLKQTLEQPKLPENWEG